MSDTFFPVTLFPLLFVCYFFLVTLFLRTAVSGSARMLIAGEVTHASTHTSSSPSTSNWPDYDPHKGTPYGRGEEKGSSLRNARSKHWTKKKGKVKDANSWAQEIIFVGQCKMPVTYSNEIVLGVGVVQISDIDTGQEILSNIQEIAAVSLHLTVSSYSVMPIMSVIALVLVKF